MRIVVWLTSSSVSAWAFAERHHARLAQAFPDAEVVRCEGENAFLGALAGADAVLVWRFEQSYFAHAPNLRLILTPAAGKDYFRIVVPETVEVSYGQFHGELMAETVVGMVLGASRGLFDAARLQPHAAWPRSRLDRRMRPLRGSHVAIWGFGRIGEWIGRLLKPFGVTVLGIRRSPMPAPAWFDTEDAICSPAHLEEILPRCDHLILCLPGGADTDRVLDATTLAHLPAHAYIYNIGRGNAIDEEALLDALRESRLAGACLDVFAQEPLAIDSPLRTAPNLLCMPHASAISPNYLDLFVDEAIDRLHSFFRQ